MSSPSLDVRVFAGLCEPGLRPLALTQALRLWLTHHFGNTAADGAPVVAGRLENTDADGPLPRMAWVPTPATGIAIEADWAWTPALTERRPALILQRGDLQKVTLGIGDSMQGTYVGDGKTRYEVGWKGGHTVYCLAGEGAEVELLAAEVARELTQFAQIVRAFLNMKKLSVDGIGKVGTVEQDGRQANFAVPIALSYAYTETWIVDPAVPPLVGGSTGISF